MNLSNLKLGHSIIALPLLYHGSPKRGIKKFDMSIRRFDSPTEGAGIYLTTSYKMARDYAGSSGSIYVCSLKSGNIFDATTKSGTSWIMETISSVFKEHKISLDKISKNHLVDEVSDIISGRGSATNAFANVRNILLNEESFVTLENYEEILDSIQTDFDLYYEKHPIVKYKDKSLDNGKATIYVVKDPNVVHIENEIVVGSEDEIKFL